LKMPTRRSVKIHWISAGLWAALLGLKLFRTWLQHSTSHAVLRADLANVLGWALAGLIVAVALVEAFILIVRRFTIFTTISIYGLYLGSAALVVVLSVMSGFESDLKQKILGTNAHIVVTAKDHPFTDYEAAARRLAGIRGVVGVTPYITNEVMISSQSNLS